MQADFPHARTLIVLRSERTLKKTGATTTESRYYLSSAPPQARTPGQWLALIRGHWGGVEIRNHWRRDVLMGEDRSRSRNANLLANLAIIRSALLQVLADHLAEQSLPEFRDNLRACPKQCLALIAKL
jgi:predicted transposase YbfD/YdcC